MICVGSRFSSPAAAGVKSKGILGAERSEARKTQAISHHHSARNDALKTVELVRATALKRAPSY